MESTSFETDHFKRWIEIIQTIEETSDGWLYKEKFGTLLVIGDAGSGRPETCRARTDQQELLEEICVQNFPLWYTIYDCIRLTKKCIGKNWTGSLRSHDCFFLMGRYTQQEAMVQPSCLFKLTGET